MTDSQIYRKHRFDNNLQTFLLVGGMMLLLSVLGYTLGGFGWLLVFFVFAAVSLTLAPKLGPKLLFRFYRAKVILPKNSPELYRMLVSLSKQAGLSRTPTLYYIPSKVHNAFAVGSGKSASIGVTHAILEEFPPREMAGILAHEISHIRNRDTVVMGLADSISRFATLLSRLGLFFVILNIPLILLGKGMSISWLAVLFMIAAPTIASLMQLGLSRTREYAADADAAQITGDPDGLAMALARLKQIHSRRSGWQRVLLPGRKVPEPSLLRTHPPTDDRIARLMELKKEIPEIQRTYQPYPKASGVEVERESDLITALFEKMPRRPRVRKPSWHMFGGTWY